MQKNKRFIIAFYTHKIFQKLSYFLGYPINKGICLSSENLDLDPLPFHKTYWPDVQIPFNLLEVAFTPIAKPNFIKKNFLSKVYHNYFIFNFLNLHLLPDLLTKIIHNYYKHYSVIDDLKLMHQSWFSAIMRYANLVEFKLTLSWFGSFNTLKFPWLYFFTIVDILETALIPIVGSDYWGVTVELPCLYFIVGTLADEINHLVLTVPYLSSEAKISKIVFKKQVREILVFSTIPILWYKFKTPNNLIKIWHSKNLNQKQFIKLIEKDLNIQLIPDLIIIKPEIL
uniref:Uncharacterized protein n=1 Tax=Nitzschia sp. PL3-2 TaxID=2083271 RepID=A0A2Z5ZA73_9STRA|nr:hypothetical protein Ycf89 [Nitzschia sp. PL3-2]BBC77449.1 hypothetical protein Ycf89 [Nitzschia sp. PL3-2]